MASTNKKHHHTTTSTSVANQPKMYVYDLSGIGSRTPEYHPTTVVTKKSSSKGYIWSLTRSLKPATKETAPVFLKQGKDRESKKSPVFEKTTSSPAFEKQGRKSVLHVEDYIVKKSPIFEGPTSSPAFEKQGRKSVSHVEDYNVTKSPAFEGPTFSHVFEKQGRKSVSHVEDYIVKGEESRRASMTTTFEATKPKRYVVEGRKSVSHVENRVAYMGKQGRGKTSSLDKEMELMQVKVLVSDMPGFMQVHAFRCARNTYDSLEKFSTKHMAFNLKKEFDKVYGPAWHCIVGSSFGSFVTHSTGCFLYFSLEKLYVLVFRTKVRKAAE